MNNGLRLVLEVRMSTGLSLVLEVRMNNGLPFVGPIKKPGLTGLMHLELLLFDLLVEGPTQTVP